MMQQYSKWGRTKALKSTFNMNGPENSVLRLRNPKIEYALEIA